jgi:hypothetical protein
LLGPFFIDWMAYRETFEREASAYIGRPVEVAGKAGMRLLPTPVLSFTNVRIGDPDNPDIVMERFRAEVELAPLLKGEVRIIQMAMERPHVRIDLAALGGAEAAENRWRVDPERVSLERLEIAKGRVSISDSATGREWEAEDIDAVVEASSLLGPGRLDAKFWYDNRPIDLVAAFGRAEGDAVTAKVNVRSPEVPVTLATEGTVTAADGEPLSYHGVATVEGVPPADDSAPRSPWADFRANGPFTLDPTQLAIDGMQFSYGAMERPLIVQATGRLDLDDAPSFDVTVGARQIDIDRTLGGGPENPLSIEDAFTVLVAALKDLPQSPAPGTLRLEAQGLVVGGSVVQAVGVDLSTVGDSWEVDSLAATLPGETRVTFDGAFDLAEQPAFRGRGAIESQRPAALASWWRGEVGSAGNINYFAVEADVDFQAGVQKLTNLVATTGEGAITGQAEFTSFQNGDRFATVELAADRADLVKARALTELIAGRNLAAGMIDQMTLSLRADVLSAGGVDAQSVIIEGGFENGQLDLRRLSIADLAGASVEASGSFADPFGEGRSGRIEASVTADDLTGAAGFLAGIAPQSRSLAHLVSVAPILSPMQADISASAGPAGGKLALDVNGSFAKTHLSLRAEGEGNVGRPETLAGTLDLHLDGEDSAGVLAQIGFDVVPIRAGPLRLDAGFSGQLASAGALKLEGSVAGIDLSYTAETKVENGRPSASGEIKASSADLDPALLLSGFALPGVGEGHAASASGKLDFSAGEARLDLSEASFGELPVAGSIVAKYADTLNLSGALEFDEISLPALTAFATGSAPGVEDGAWSEAAFAATTPSEFALDFDVKAQTLDLGAPIPATEAALKFEMADGNLSLDLASAKFAGGVLKGALAAALREGEAQVSLRGTLTGGELQGLVWERAGLPVASGAIDVSLDAEGTGRSMAGLIATLNGSGTLAISNGRLNSLNSDALKEVLKAAESSDEPDEEQARETFASLFGSGALAFGDSVGSFSIVGGVLTMPTVSLEAGATTVFADATLDLSQLAVASTWRVQVDDGLPGDQPEVNVLFSGPVAEPERRIDLARLLQLLSVRFQERQIAEIEMLSRAQAEAEAAAAAAAAAATSEEAPPSGGPGFTASPEAGSPEPPVTEPDIADGAAPEPAAAEPDLAPEPGEVAPPLNLVPENTEPAESIQPEPAAAPEETDAPAETEEAAEPAPEPAPSRRRPRASGNATAPPPPPPPPPPEEFRTLPNGVIVKIR